MDPTAPSPEADKSRFSTCGVCGGMREVDGAACAACGGLGAVRRPPARDEVDPAKNGTGEIPDWFTACAEFMEAAGLIEKWGLDGARTVLGMGRNDEWHPAFLEALVEFHGELDRLDRESRLKDVDEQRKKKR
jgi:hypothetical protein